MEKLLNKFMHIYLSDKEKKVDSKAEYYDILRNVLPAQVAKLFDSSEYLVTGSVGKGQTTKHPWICIFDRKITKSAQNGIYIALLFRSDMKGFYLALNQGMKFFEQYKKQKLEVAQKAAYYFSSKIDTSLFSKNTIDLVSNKSDKGFGYEKTTVIARYFEVDTFTNRELLESITYLKEIYQEIVELIGDNSYSEFIENKLNSGELEVYPAYGFIDVDEAESMIDAEMISLSDKPDGTIRTFTNIPVPSKSTSNHLSKKTTKKYGKKDYLKQAKKNMELGLRGEVLVLKSERDRLISEGQPKSAAKIKWVSEKDDTVGYDILSYRKNKNDIYEEVYIEVKTTEGSSKNTFFISQNEVNKLRDNRESYMLYRVIVNKKKESAEYFLLDYSTFLEKYDLVPLTYMAKFK